MDEIREDAAGKSKIGTTRRELVLVMKIKLEEGQLSDGFKIRE